MKRFTVVLLAVSALGLGVAAQASAFEGGGVKPSEAPLISFGQHYTAQLNNHKAEANYGGFEEVALWRLPPVGTRDIVVVNWHSVPYTHGSSFPICMMLVQNVDDFSWGTAFGQDYNECESGYRLSGSGSAQTSITVQETNSTATYLEFFVRANTETPSDQETYPYDFSVEAPRRFVALALKEKQQVHANGAIAGTATLANGLPVPDGLGFNMTVTWGDNGIATYTAGSFGGTVTFPLALPEDAVGERATFTVARPTDGGYQAVGATLKAKVTAAKLIPEGPSCSKLTQRAHVLARQYKRLKKNAGYARGYNKRRLKHRAHQVNRKLQAARAKAHAVCAA
jgi:hypothetical protein